MIQLIAYNQSTDSANYLDIDADEDISLNFQVSEVQDFSSRKSSRSNSFSLPFTDTNNQFFNHLYNVNLATGSFNIYQKTKCELQVDSLTQIQGYLYVESVNLLTERYEVVVIGETGNLKDELGEKKLQDLDETWQNTFAHLLTKDNLVASWDDDITYLGASTADKSVIKYPFVNYGIDNRIWTLGGNNSNDIADNSYPINPREFKPAMKLKTIFDRILSESGYSYDSQFFATSGFNINDVYMTLANQSEMVNYRPQNYGFLVNLGADQNIPTISATVINLNDEIYDINTDFNTTNKQWTCPFGGYYQFKFKVSVEFTRNDGAGDTSVNYAFYSESTGINWFTSQTFLIAPDNDGETVTVTHTFIAPMFPSTGDVIEFRVTQQRVGIPSAVTSFNVLRTYNSVTTGVQMIEQPYNPNGASIYLQDNWPDMSQINFLKSFFEQFNMFVEPKQDNPKELLIDPYPIYMDTGTTLDWTDKLDESKEIQIIPTTNFRKSKLTWEWKEDKNYLDVYRRDISKKPYGAFVYEDQSDLTEGEFKNFTEFSSPTNRLININGTSSIYEICLMDLTARDSNGSAVPLKGNPRIAYFKKKDLVDGEQAIYIYDDLTDLPDAVYSYGYFGHYSDIPATSGVFNLNWSDTYSGIYNFGVWVDSATENNVFTQYWKQYLNEIYTSEARMVNAYFNLNSVDIHNLRFNNKIFVKDAFYRINKISNYKINNTQPTMVELIKLGVGNAGLGNKCNLLIGSFEASGTVNFINSETGASETGNRDCCEAYGYSWQAEGDGGSCYWKPFNNVTDDIFRPDANTGTPEGG
jgi:hypothetical protein